MSTCDIGTGCHVCGALRFPVFAHYFRVPPCRPVCSARSKLGPEAVHVCLPAVCNLRRPGSKACGGHIRTGLQPFQYMSHNSCKMMLVALDLAWRTANFVPIPTCRLVMSLGLSSSVGKISGQCRRSVYLQSSAASDFRQARECLQPVVSSVAQGRSQRLVADLSCS